MAINVSVQYSGGFLPDMMLLMTRCYYHRGTRLNAMKRFFFVCVCVVIPFILDVRLVDVPAGVTQEKGHTEFQDLSTRYLPSAVLAFSREKDSALASPGRP